MIINPKTGKELRLTERIITFGLSEAETDWVEKHKPKKACEVIHADFITDLYAYDIDLNFSGEYQARAHQYLVEMFGEDKVLHAGAVATISERVAGNMVRKYLSANGRVATAAERDRLVQSCTGVRRTTGHHPGGFVVIPDGMDAEDFCPVQHPANDPYSDVISTHFAYRGLEDNLLKLGLLGHDDLTMIHMLERLTGVNAREIPLDDPDTLSLFTTSERLGFTDDEVLGSTGAAAIPEFGTRFVREVLVDTQPRSFDALLRILGFCHGTNAWIDNADGLISSGTAGLSETVSLRDDIMRYLNKKGLDPKMSFQIMEAVRKGRVRKNGFEDGWVEAMRDHGVPRWYIDSLAKIGYLFPRAHAASYVMMAFRIAWFKVHHPLAFYAAYFTVRGRAFDAAECCFSDAKEGAEKTKRRIREIGEKIERDEADAKELDILPVLEVCYEFHLRGYHFESVDIFHSDATEFLITGNGLLPPLTSVHGISEAAARDTVEKRAGKKFSSVEEFAAVCGKLTETNIERLRALGAFKGMDGTRQA